MASQVRHRCVDVAQFEVGKGACIGAVVEDGPVGAEFRERVNGLCRHSEHDLAHGSEPGPGMHVVR